MSVEPLAISPQPFDRRGRPGVATPPGGEKKLTANG